MSNNDKSEKLKELDQYLKKIEKAYKTHDFSTEMNITNILVRWVHDNKNLINGKIYKKLREIYLRQANNLVGILEFDRGVRILARLISLEKSVYSQMNLEQSLQLINDYMDLANNLNESGDLEQAILTASIAIQLLEDLDYEENSRIAAKLLDCYLLIMQFFAMKENIPKLMEYHRRLVNLNNIYKNNYSIPKKDRLNVLTHFSRSELAAGESIKNLKLLEYLLDELSEENVAEYADIYRAIGKDYMTILQLVPEKVEELNKTDELFNISEEIFKKLIKEERSEKNLVELANLYLYKGNSNKDYNYEIAKEYYKKALDLFEELSEIAPLTKYESAQGLIYKCLGQICFYQDDFDLALSYIEKAIEIENKQYSYFDNPEIFSHIINADIYKNMILKISEKDSFQVERTDHIIEKYYELFEITKDIEDRNELVDFLITEADYFDRELEETEKAIEYFNKAIENLLEIVESQPQRKNILNYCYARLQEIYEELGEIELVEELENKMNKIDQEMFYSDDEFVLMRKFLQNFSEGMNCQDQGEIAEGLEFLIRADEYMNQIAEISEDTHIPFYLGSVKANIGRSYFELNEGTLGVPYLEEAIPFLLENYKDNPRAFEMLNFSVMALSHQYQELDRTEESIDYLEMMHEILLDSLEKDLSEENLIYMSSIYRLLPKAYAETQQAEKLNNLIDEIIDLVLKLNPTTANADITGVLLDSAYISCIIDSSLIENYLDKLKVFSQIFELLHKKGFLDLKTKLSLFNIDYELSLESQDPEEQQVLYEKVLKIGGEIQKEEYSPEIAIILDSIRELFLKT